MKKHLFSLMRVILNDLKFQKIVLEMVFCIMVHGLSDHVLTDKIDSQFHE